MPPKPITTVTGHCAFYIRPDIKTMQEAITYSSRIGSQPTYTATEPLISLYQAEFHHAPIDEIDRILDAISGVLLHGKLPLERTNAVTVGNHESLRWMARYDKKNVSTEPLYKAHTMALGLARWLNQPWLQYEIKEAKARKPLPPRDAMSNIIDFGREDVRLLYEPYMLLAIAGNNSTTRNPRQNATHVGIIEQVGFAVILRAEALKIMNVISVRT